MKREVHAYRKTIQGGHGQEYVFRATRGVFNIVDYSHNSCVAGPAWSWDFAEQFHAIF